MHCPECDSSLATDAVACTCGWRAATLVVATDWINQTCSSPGCTVVIRSRVGHQAPGAPVCKWCQEGAAYYRFAESDPQRHFGPLVTKEEFGLDLYEAINLLSGIETAKKKAVLLTENGKIAAAREAENWIREAETKLNEILERGTIPPADMRRLLGIQKPPKPNLRAS